ncbi:Nuclear mRNA export protein SAC3 [Pseudozyma hubeiensis]|nr:Nuclear mRNA export protein SAC3 [Pseudozyma hubeiensis]
MIRAQPSSFPPSFGNTQPQSHQQQPAFSAPRPVGSAPSRPQSQQSTFGAPSPFNGGQQPRPQQSSFNASRPFVNGQQSQSHPQPQQSSTFGSRPRPFTSRPTGPGFTQEGRPPHSGPGNQHVSRPRPRPFANKSTTFNTHSQENAPTEPFAARSDGPPSASVSAFASQSVNQGAESLTAPSAFGQPSPSFSSTQTPSSSLGPGTSAFGSTSAANQASSSTSAFGGFSKPSDTSAFGSASQPSAFASTTGTSTSTSAFGTNQGISPFGASSFSAPQSQSQPSTAPPSAAPARAPQTTSNSLAASSSAVPTSSFSNFLRKDRSGASTPGTGTATPFTSSGTGTNGAEDEDELRKKRFEDAPKVGNRFLEMKGGREALRNAYIKSGVLPDPDKPTDLALAVKLVGTCQDMCPEFEREEREFQKELDPLELYPGTDRVDPRIAVKIYRRPAAGRELPLPEDVRPPPVLKRTLDYLFHDLLPSDPNDARFTQVQGFLWNRTRAVRQDFIVQSEGGPIAIECHERIARYHILCLHWRGGPGAEGWSEQQELEQLRKTMRSLMEFYDDARRKSVASNAGGSAKHASPNEAEFRAYSLLLHLRDPETLREAELLPGDIFRSPLVQTAIQLRQLAQRSNNLEKRGQPRNTEATLNFFSKFFAELRKPNVNYLMACLAENSFSSVRIGAVKAMSKAYMAQHRGLPIDRVQHVLGMDSPDQVVSMATHLGLELEYEADVAVGVKIHRSATIKEDKPLPTPFSTSIVEAKRGSSTSADVVDGRTSGARAVPHAQISTVSTPSAQPSATTAPTNAIPSFGLNQVQQSGAPPFGPSQPQQSAVFGSTSSSKLSPAAKSFTPTAFGTSDSSKTSTFGAFSGFGNKDSKKDASSGALPSFGGFGKSLAQSDGEASSASTPFGSKAPASSTPFSSSESKPSSGFSFGQPTGTSSPAKESSKGASASLPSFSFGDAATPKSESSKSATPSFFGSSLSKQSAGDKPSEAPTSHTDAKRENSTPAPSSQKRRASDSKENAAAQAAAAAKAEADKKAEAKRKEAAKSSAIDRAFKKLSDEVVRSAAQKTAARAVEEEEARRRAASRNDLLARITDKLWTRLAEEHAAQVAEETSRKAAAEVFQSRSCAMRAWSRWTEVLEERRDREQQRRRLEDIRGEIRRRNILGRVQPDASGLATSPTGLGVTSKTPDQEDASPIRKAFSIRRSLLTGERIANSVPRTKRKLEDDFDKGRATPRGDVELSERWTRVRRQRSQLWAEGSLLERLADHIEELLLQFRPADLDRLVILYSGAPGRHVASSWLRVKFGFSPAAPTEGKEEDSGRDVLEIDLVDGSHLDLVDVTPSSVGSHVDLEQVLPDRDEHSQPGLVIFETSPGIAHAQTAAERREMFAEDRKRLEDVAKSKLVRGSQLACRLLVVSWGGAGSDQSDATPTSDDGDVEMTDLHMVSASDAGRRESLLGALGIDAGRAVPVQASKPRSSSAYQLKPSAILQRAFERVGVLELDDASVSVEDTLGALLRQAVPDLTPNPALYLDGSRRSTLEDVALPFYEQWTRTSALLFELLSGLPPALLSGRSAARSTKVEQVACKTLQILSALANHILRTILSLSETILEDENTDNQGLLELPLPSASHNSTTGQLVKMALSQLESLPDDDSEQKLHLRSRLLSSLRQAPDLKQELAVVTKQHIDGLFRHRLDKLQQVWLGLREGMESEAEKARDVFARLCEAAVDEVADETRGIWRQYRAEVKAQEVEEDVEEEREEDQVMVSPSNKRFRRDDSSSVVMEEVSPVKVKTSRVNELRDLIARTRRFLDTESH